MANSKIRWKRGDYIRLGRAVSDFNKRINELQQEENKLYLPTPLNYNITKENITTRKELNRIINSLRRFQKEDAGELYTTEAGEQITKWEKQELNKQQRIASRRLNQELQSLKNSSPSGLMGEGERRRIERTISRLGKLEKATGEDFQRLKKTIKFQGALDYSMKRALTYRENFLNELKDLASANSDFQKVYEYFKGITNPEKFFETTQKSNVLQDFFQWYKTPNSYLSTMTGDELASYLVEQYKL